MEEGFHHNPYNDEGNYPLRRGNDITLLAFLDGLRDNIGSVYYQMKYTKIFFQIKFSNIICHCVSETKLTLEEQSLGYTLYTILKPRASTYSRLTARLLHIIKHIQMYE